MLLDAARGAIAGVECVHPRDIAGEDRLEFARIGDRPASEQMEGRGDAARGSSVTGFDPAGQFLQLTGEGLAEVIPAGEGARPAVCGIEGDEA